MPSCMSSLPSSTSTLLCLLCALVTLRVQNRDSNRRAHSNLPFVFCLPSHFSSTLPFTPVPSSLFRLRHSWLFSSGAKLAVFFRLSPRRYLPHQHHHKRDTCTTMRTRRSVYTDCVLPKPIRTVNTASRGSSQIQPEPSQPSETLPGIDLSIPQDSPRGEFSLSAIRHRKG
jgi:hypothetical protein